MLMTYVLGSPNNGMSTPPDGVADDLIEADVPVPQFGRRTRRLLVARTRCHPVRTRRKFPGTSDGGPRPEPDHVLQRSGGHRVTPNAKDTLMIKHRKRV